MRRAPSGRLERPSRRLVWQESEGKPGVDHRAGINWHIGRNPAGRRGVRERHAGPGPRAAAFTRAGTALVLPEWAARLPGRMAATAVRSRAVLHWPLRYGLHPA